MRSQRGGIPLSGQTDMQLMTGIQNITTKYTDVIDIDWVSDTGNLYKIRIKSVDPGEWWCPSGAQATRPPLHTQAD